LFRINPQENTLSSIEYLPDSTTDWKQLFAQGNIFQGGNFHMLHRLLGITSGESVLYVGDHIFADILKSKRSLGWRTCLIVPELSREMEIHNEQRSLRLELMEMRRQQYILERELDALQIANSHQQQAADSCAMTTTPRNGSHEDFQVLQGVRDEVDRKHRELEAFRTHLRTKLRSFDKAFHSRWGSVSDTLL
jgi:5'-nucleotidase